MKKKAVVKFTESTGMCESPGIYIKAEHLAMAKPQVPAFGHVISIETAMDLIDGLVAALEEYEEWENGQTE